MEIKKNKSHGLFSQDSKSNKLKEYKDEIRSFLKEMLDNQVFFNSRLKALEFVEKQKNISTAMLTMNISKVKGFLGSDYEIKFSILYSFTDGKVYQTNNFYTVEMPGKEGMIPNYILRELNHEDELDIKFNSDDLTRLYDEKNEKIDEESTFEEVINICKKNDVASIQMIDRVFYTRIVCFGPNKETLGTMHIGSLHGVPRDLDKVLYPGGHVEYKL